MWGWGGDHSVGGEGGGRGGALGCNHIYPCISLEKDLIIGYLDPLGYNP